jgi:hypothetical protein
MPRRKKRNQFSELVVGARGFEPRTSCAQDGRVVSRKSFPFNINAENNGVSGRFASGRMYENVAPHAWGPHTFPHSEEEAKDSISRMRPFQGRFSF